MSRLPTQENCDQDNPKEAFQWAFGALPFAGSTPMMVDPNARPEWSQLFWDLGFRHHPELQTRRIAPPHRGPEHALNPGVMIVDKDAPNPDPVAIQHPSSLNQYEQDIQLEEYRHMGRIPEVVKEPPSAEVYAGAGGFNPADHTPSVVNGYLMGVSLGERRRVLASEMAGKKRDQILRKWPGE